MSRVSIIFTIFVTLLLAGVRGSTVSQAGMTLSNGLQQSGRKSASIDCLPEGLKSTDIVSRRQKDSGSEEPVTVADKLAELKARCQRGELVDVKGKRIKFFKIACYGNPPSDYEEIRQRESEELERLQKSYTVIVIECDRRIS